MKQINTAMRKLVKEAVVQEQAMRYMLNTLPWWVRVLKAAKLLIGRM